MRIVFNVNESDMTAAISPASVKALAALPPIARADLLGDVMADATMAYDAAVTALQSHLAGPRSA
jgi:hypothetical protein